MEKLIYPAIFEPDHEEGGYCVYFPDLPGCATEGDTLEDAFDMAKEAMSGWLASYLEDHPAPKATELNEVINKLGSGEYDDDDYRFNRSSLILLVEAGHGILSQIQKKAVRVNTSIPAWMKTEADRRGINISKVLQNALINEFV